MAVSDIPDPEKIAVSDNWIKKHRATFDISPLLKHGFLAVEQAHHDLVTLNKQRGTIEAQVSKLTDAIGSRDGFHDRKARGGWYVLTGAIELADSEEEAAPYLEARDILYPEGMSIVTASYRAQAGTAEKVKQRITPDVERVLARTKVGERTLLEEVNAWLAAAGEISKKVAERAEIAGELDDAVRAADIHAARLKWVGAVNDLLQLIRIAGIDADTRRVLLANLYEAERKAMAAKSRQKQVHTTTETFLDELPAPEPADEELTTD